MKSTEHKLDALREEYAGIDNETLMELLVASDGSLLKTRALLDESLGRKSAKHSLYQASITAMLRPNRKRKLEHSESPMETGGKTKVVTLNDDDYVKELLSPYVSLHRNFLQPSVANKCLSYLMENSHKFTPKSFYLFDNLCQSNHSAGFLYLPSDNKDLMEASSYYDGVQHRKIEFNANVREISQTINSFINNDIIPNFPRLPLQPKEGFAANACVVNYYSKLSNNLEWHSDRLQQMGPHNFVVSLSLGATREFKLRRHSSPRVIYSIPLPHNSVLIMHPGCQELFQHSVSPMKKSLQLHPLCGATRFNLTFRHYPESFVKHVPKCKCNIPMVLRRAYKKETKENFGKYHWSCENVYRNKDCKTFHWADLSNTENKFIAEDDSHASCWKGE